MAGRKKRAILGLVAAIRLFSFHPVIRVLTIHQCTSFQPADAYFGMVFVPCQIKVLEICKENYAEVVVHDVFHVLGAENFIRLCSAVPGLNSGRFDRTDVSLIPRMDFSKKVGPEFFLAIFPKHNLTPMEGSDRWRFSEVHEMETPLSFFTNVEYWTVIGSIQRPYIRALVFYKVIARIRQLNPQCEERQNGKQGQDPSEYRHQIPFFLHREWLQIMIGCGLSVCAMRIMGINRESIERGILRNGRSLALGLVVFAIAVFLAAQGLLLASGGEGMTHSTPLIHHTS